MGSTGFARKVDSHWLGARTSSSAMSAKRELFGWTTCNTANGADGDVRVPSIHTFDPPMSTFRAKPVQPSSACTITSSSRPKSGDPSL
ncbi:MAG TPA: hypothetical protein VHQ95_04665, partial [Pyrinomonadaceae bacterium]|nr:hypothetical protein [Pyrinomonadaceae bacterium]